MKLPAPRRLPSGSYHIQLRLNGRSVSITERTAKECTRKAELIKAQHIAGVEEKIAAKDTLGGIVDAYIAEVGPVLSPSTVRGYKQIRANYFQAYFEKLPHKVNFQQMMELGGWADHTTMHRIYVRISESSKDKSREKMLTFFENANATAHGA